MNSRRNNWETVGTITKAVDKWLDKGMCPACAFVACGVSFGLDPERVEQVYVDAQVAKLDEERSE